MDDSIREARHHGLTEGDPGDEQKVETPPWLEDNLPETCYTKDECMKRIRAGGPASCRRQPACSS